MPENEYLGTLKLTGLPKGPRGSIQVEVSFEVSNESLLKVSARELSTGREVSATLFTKDTPEAVRSKMATLSDPNLRAVNVLIRGLLGRGVAASSRFDPQAKGLGEWARSRHVEVPEELL